MNRYPTKMILKTWREIKNDIFFWKIAFRQRSPIELDKNCQTGLWSANLYPFISYSQLVSLRRSRNSHQDQRAPKTVMSDPWCTKTVCHTARFGITPPSWHLDVSVLLTRTLQALRHWYFQGSHIPQGMTGVQQHLFFFVFRACWNTQRQRLFQTAVLLAVAAGKSPCSSICWN